MRKLGGFKELINFRQGMYRAKLAEAYDGIGQYVLVSLSGTSTGAAYKARVAAGDFGGSRAFPAGTPVVVHSYHGAMEVFLGNIPQLCILLDNFDRSGINPGANSYDGKLWGFETAAPGVVVPVTNGSQLEINFTTVNRTAYMYFETPTVGMPDLLLKTEPFSFSVRFKQNALTIAASDIIRFLWYGPGFSEEIRATLELGTTFSTLRLKLSDGANESPATAIPDLEANEWYIIQIDIKPNFYGRMTLYKEDDGFDGWVIDLPDDGGVDISASPLWDFTNELAAGYLMTRVYDYIKFCPISDSL